MSLLLLLRPESGSSGTGDLVGSSASFTWSVSSGSLSANKDLVGSSALQTWSVSLGTLAAYKDLVGLSPSLNWTVNLGTLSTVKGLISGGGGGSGVGVIIWSVSTGSLSSVIPAQLIGASAILDWIASPGDLTLGKSLIGDSPAFSSLAPSGVLTAHATLIGSSAVVTWIGAGGTLSTAIPMQALYQMYNLRARLDVKYEMDSGRVNAVSTDVSGTSVLFNKTFKDVDSITVTPESTVERKVVYDFADVPNPTGFSVYLYNTAGARVTGIVSWKARGKR